MEGRRAFDFDLGVVSDLTGLDFFADAVFFFFGRSSSEYAEASESDCWSRAATTAA
jgi:hypothetical protein